MENIANEELLPGILRACQLDSPPLLDRLQELLGDPEPYEHMDPHQMPESSMNLLARLQELFGGLGITLHPEGGEIPEAEEIPEDAPAPAPCTASDPLWIPRPLKPLRVTSQEEFDAYWGKVQNLRDLEAFLDKYRGPEVGPLYKLAEKMASRIQQKPAPVYELDEDNTEQLVKYVQKHVLKYGVGKLSEPLFRAWHEERQTPEEQELTEALNAYLGRLGIYTMIAGAGESFSSVSQYYDTLVYHESMNVADEIVRVESPAYVLEYIDMTGAPQQSILPGKCLLKVRQ